MPSLVKASPCDYCKAPERLCPYCEYGGRSVSLDFINGINYRSGGLPAYGVMTGSIESVVVRWGSTDLVSPAKVPVGDLFHIRVIGVNAQNPGSGDWDVAVTVAEIPATGALGTPTVSGVENTGQYKNLFRQGGYNGLDGSGTGSWSGTSGTTHGPGASYSGAGYFDVTHFRSVGQAEADGQFKMPNKDLRLRVMLWGFPLSHLPSTDSLYLPDSTKW